MSAGLVQRLSPNLTGTQRRELRAMAHDLKPIVTIGFSGVNDGVCQALDIALYDHELVKVKVLNSYDGSLDEIADELCKATGCALAQKIGRILLCYRQNPDNPVIVLKAKGNKAAPEEEE